MINKIKNDLKIFLEEKYKELYSVEIDFVVEEPKKEGHGDISIPVFVISKVIKKPLPVVAEELKTVIEESDFSTVFSKVVVMGGFLNIYTNRLVISKNIITTLIKAEDIGAINIGDKKTICIDYSAPNIAKPFSVGHLRSTIIGHSLSMVLKKLGYTVIGINHLGDFGTQFGKVIYAYNNWGNESVIKKDPVNELLKLYIRFHEEAEKDPTLDDRAREIFQELEQGNKEYVALWTWIKEESMKGLHEMYNLLNVSFDSYNGESFYNDKMDVIVDKLTELKVLEEDQGAMIVRLEGDIPPALIKRTDGATLYITRDLAAVKYRKDNYDFDECLYVVGGEQKLHFEQVRQVVTKMGNDYADSIKHIDFGLVLQNGKKMSTRKGNTVRLIDVIKEAIDMSFKHINEKNPTLANKEDVAKKIGVSAVIFNDLKNHRTNSFEFDLEGMLKYEGQTGPYLQYTSVRINSILKSQDFNIDNKIDYTLFDNEHFFDLIKELGSYTEVLLRVRKEYAPNYLAKYLLNLASKFNSFYAKEKIIVEDKLERDTKLCLISLVREVLNDGMVLLGMQIVEKM